MTRILVLSAAVITIFTACSKKEVNAPVADVAPTAPAARPDDVAIIKAGLDEISKKVQAQQYEAAVGSMAALNAMPKTPEQQAVFMNQVRQVQNELAQKAAQGDQRAEESRRMMGRFMTGR